jgi:REP element-mobilizing transposase RayT
MPDHLHVVILGLDRTSRVKRAMEAFKESSGTWLKYNRPNVEWQDDFYDEIVRGSKGWAQQIRYVALNPVRAGLAEHIHAYPFTGSIGCDLDESCSTRFGRLRPKAV